MLGKLRTFIDGQSFEEGFELVSRLCVFGISIACSVHSMICDDHRLLYLAVAFLLVKGRSDKR